MAAAVSNTYNCPVYHAMFVETNNIHVVKNINYPINDSMVKTNTLSMQASGKAAPCRPVQHI